MTLVAETALPTLPVATLEFSANPDPYLLGARREHPRLARAWGLKHLPIAFDLAPAQPTAVAAGGAA
jgi:hypothetical protein